MMSKNVRAEAILLLSALGSKTMSEDVAPGAFFDYAEHLDVSDDGVAAARAAYDAVPSLQETSAIEGGCSSFARECLEAAQMLNEGWEKGDDISFRPGRTIQCRSSALPDSYDEGVN